MQIRLENVVSSLRKLIDLSREKNNENRQRKDISKQIKENYSPSAIIL